MWPGIFFIFYSNKLFSWRYNNFMLILRNFGWFKPTFDWFIKLFLIKSNKWFNLQNDVVETIKMLVKTIINTIKSKQTLVNFISMHLFDDPSKFLLNQPNFFLILIVSNNRSCSKNFFLFYKPIISELTKLF